MPMTFMTNKHRETIRQHCTRNPDNVDFPEYLPTSRNGEKEEEEDFSDEEEEAGDEKWDLIEVIDEKSLKKKKSSHCSIPQREFNLQNEKLIISLQNMKNSQILSQMKIPL